MLFVTYLPVVLTVSTKKQYYAKYSTFLSRPVYYYLSIIVHDHLHSNVVLGRSVMSDLL